MISSLVWGKKQQGRQARVLVWTQARPKSLTLRTWVNGKDFLNQDSADECTSQQQGILALLAVCGSLLSCQNQGTKSGRALSSSLLVHCPPNTQLTTIPPAQNLSPACCRRWLSKDERVCSGSWAVGNMHTTVQKSLALKTKDLSLARSRKSGI